ncbi:PEGA domain-containing protein [Flocculibacter collagenilyticus]|uniref:PEGA domain-containing protein n=1 Tax=Flocculibacter collagenilyticus TaxID=2744479 RepID=UPI0018F384B7|nr:PEGA domain-containing protein [Flocculibacter collagenilyticus]
MSLKHNVNDTVIKPTSFTPTQVKRSGLSIVIKPALVVLGILLLAGAVVIWFLFTAKAVRFSTESNLGEPVTAQINVEGGVLFELADHYLMLPGDYQVTAHAEGFQPLKQTISVGKAQNQLLPLTLQILPGHITVEVLATPTPQENVLAQATVSLNDEVVGNLLERIEHVEAGQYLLSIKSKWYQPYQQEITVNGADSHQVISVTLAPNWADVNIASTPLDAKVKLTQKNLSKQVGSGLWMLGETPIVTPVIAGDYLVTIEKPGFKSWRKDISLTPGQAFSLNDVLLTRLDGELVVGSKPSNASVTLTRPNQAPVFLGNTPLSVALLPDEKHQLTLFKDGYQAATKTVQLASGETDKLTINLQPDLGEIKLQANPSDALLYIDGILMGRASQTVRLSAKAHEVVVKKDGFVDYSTTVTPLPSQQQVLNIQLKTTEQHKWETIARQITLDAGPELKLFKPNVTFMMGSSRREQGRRANEARHTVKLTRPFYISKYEITNKQFRRFERMHSSGNVQGNSLNNENFPVVKVTWNQAALYCNWLSEQENLPAFYKVEEGVVVGMNESSNGYRMPTEAEFTWLARYKGKMADTSTMTASTKLSSAFAAPLTTTKYSWGQQLPPSVQSGNFADRTAASILGNIVPNYDDGFIVAAPVNTFQGDLIEEIADLAGNVAEWTNDYYQIKTGLSLKAEVDPVGKTKSDFHVIRGSSWRHGTMTTLRLAYRDYGFEGRTDVGFRIARYVDEKSQDETETPPEEKGGLQSASQLAQAN